MSYIRFLPVEVQQEIAGLLEEALDQNPDLKDRLDDDQQLLEGELRALAEFRERIHGGGEAKTKKGQVAKKKGMRRLGGVSAPPRSPLSTIVGPGATATASLHTAIAVGIGRATQAGVASSKSKSERKISQASRLNTVREEDEDEGEEGEEDEEDSDDSEDHEEREVKSAKMSGKGKISRPEESRVLSNQTAKKMQSKVKSKQQSAAEELQPQRRSARARTTTKRKTQGFYNEQDSNDDDDEEEEGEVDGDEYEASRDGRITDDVINRPQRPVPVSSRGKGRVGPAQTYTSSKGPDARPSSELESAPSKPATLSLSQSRNMNAPVLGLMIEDMDDCDDVVDESQGKLGGDGDDECDDGDGDGDDDWDAGQMNVMRGQTAASVERGIGSREENGTDDLFSDLPKKRGKYGSML